jgi:hypothetical protein
MNGSAWYGNLEVLVFFVKSKQGYIVGKMGKK